jgi:hypothetical protein
MNYTKVRVQLRKKLLLTNSWVAVLSGITIDVALKPKCSVKLGKKKDTFGFSVNNVKNTFNETFYDGDALTTDFNVKWGPIPEEHQSGAFKKLHVYVDDVEVFNYTFINNGTTISFDAAPASGTGNIKLVYPVFEQDDVVRIYRVRNTTAFSDADIIMEGVIVTVMGGIGPDETNLSISGQSFLTQLFKGLVFTRPSGALDYAHQYIQDIIAQINQFNQDRPIYGETAGEWTNIGNATTTKDIQYSMSYKTAIEIIEDLSTNDNTGDGQYMYFLLYNSTDERYEFNWVAKDADSDYNLVEGTDMINTVKLSIDTDEVINAAIYNCGQDCEGNSMEFPFFDFTSGGGSKWKYITSTNTIAETLIVNEFDNNVANWATQTLADGTEKRTVNYPTAYGGPAYEMQFLGRDANGAKNAVAVTPGNDTDFNDAIWTEAKWQGWGKAKAIVDVLKDPKQKLVVEMDYGSDTNSSYAIGNIVTCTFPSFGINAIKLRIDQIDYALATTTLHLAEDEVTLDN